MYVFEFSALRLNRMVRGKIEVLLLYSFGYVHQPCVIACIYVFSTYPILFCCMQVFEFNALRLNRMVRGSIELVLPCVFIMCCINKFGIITWKITIHVVLFHTHTYTCKSLNSVLCGWTGWFAGVFHSCYSMSLWFHRLWYRQFMYSNSVLYGSTGELAVIFNDC